MTKRRGCLRHSSFYVILGRDAVPDPRISKTYCLIMEFSDENFRRRWFLGFALFPVYLRCIGGRGRPRKPQTPKKKYAGRQKDRSREINLACCNQRLYGRAALQSQKPRIRSSLPPPLPVVKNNPCLSKAASPPPQMSGYSTASAACSATAIIIWCSSKAP